MAGLAEGLPSQPVVKRAEATRLGRYRQRLGGAWDRRGRYRQADSPRSLARMRLVVDTESMLGLRQCQRLERDLHDGAQQRLVSLALTLRKAREKLDSEPGEAGRLLDRSRAELDEALKELREPLVNHKLIGHRTGSITRPLQPVGQLRL
jgi:signal transduction histidine kinase